MSEKNTVPEAPEANPLLFIPEAKEDGMRLDLFLAGRAQELGLSRERVKRLIKEGAVRIRREICLSPRESVRQGTPVSLQVPETATQLAPEAGELTVLYRDAALVVLDKPPGLTVHPCPGRPDGTLAHRLVAHFPELARLEGFRPGIVHRLDKDTSGLLLAALSEESRLALSRAFAEHAVHKEYLALVSGVPAKTEGIIEAPVGRHPHNKVKMTVTASGKYAKSAWRILYADADKRFSLLAVRIFTGRTHQIRVHMAHMGHSILGDAVYAPHAGREEPGAAPRQMLHAWKLEFAHPFPALAPNREQQDDTETHDVIRFTCPPPEDFSQTVERLCTRMLRVVITGSPGCGKSTLLAALKERKIPVFSADAAVAALYAPGGDGQRLLRARFGTQFVPLDDGPVERTLLGEAMRASPELRREVEALLHPLVRHRMLDFWEKEEQRGAPLAVAEVPLFLEAGFAGNPSAKDGKPEWKHPLLVGVHCSLAIRVSRLKENRDWNDEVIAAVESWQWPEDRKMKACDVVIENTGTARELAEKTEGLLKKLADLRAERIRAQVAAVKALYR